ncbi:MAG: thiolase family protein [Sphingomonadaceae bacterium]|nr:thiolase family protein [Sphingomonadaceae bacterium]
MAIWEGIITGMAQAGFVDMPPSVQEASRKVSIVGIGESDFHLDYRAERERADGWEPRTVEDMCKKAFERALADSGLKRSDIDGLAMSYTYGGPEPSEMATHFGIQPKLGWINGHIFAGPLPNAAGRIMAGDAEVIALVFGIANRSAGRQFGGMTFASGAAGPSSYYYHHPWGWSSQAAHWALMAQRYFAKYGKGEEDLGHVPMTVRKHAATDPNAVMQKPFTIDEYMASRYIVRPLHLFDICLVTDGAVCVIISEADRARDMAKVPVDVAGWGHSLITQDKMKVMIEDRLRPQLQDAGGQALRMAGLSIDDIGHFEGYDASSIHLVNQVEGFGFTEPGTGLDFCIDGQMTLGGRIPTNMNGGNMSYSYMQGWGQVPEIVRQLRHEAGPRQIEGLQASMSALTQTDIVHPVVYTRGD